MDEYDLLLSNKSKLRFKGDKKKDKSKSDNESSDEKDKANLQLNRERKADADLHGGWWKITDNEHITGFVALEFLPGRYARALDDGTIVLGDQHEENQGPDEEEIFTAIRAPSSQFALKSGFDMYLALNKERHLVGLSEAIGERELFLPCFEDTKMAICCYNNRFLTADVDSETRPIIGQNDKVGPREIMSIRVNGDPLKSDR